MRRCGILEASRPRWFWATAGCLLAAAAIFGIWVVLGLGGAGTTSAVDNIGQLIAPLIAAGACGWAARRKAATRRAWAFIGASGLSWAIGQAIWCYYSLVRNVAVPFPSLADVGYLAAVPLAVVGLLAFPSNLRRVTSRLGALLDGMLIAGSLLFLSWATVLGPIYGSHRGDVLRQVLSMAYPAGDVVLVSLVVILARHTALTNRRSLGLVMIGVVAFAVSDSSFAYFTEVDRYGSGNVFDIGWVVGYLLIALGAWWTLVSPPNESESSETELVTLMSVLIPYVMVGMAGAAVAVRLAQGRSFGLFLASEGFILLVVLGLRQVLTLLDNLTLNRRLHTKLELGTQALRDREARYSALVEHSSDAITIVGEDAAVVYQSPSVTHVLGWDKARTAGSNLLDFLHPEDHSRWQAVVGRLKTDPNDEVTTEWRIRHLDGTWRIFQSVVTNLLDEPSVNGLVLNSRDVTDQRALEDQLRHQAFHDPLTALANRALFAEHLEQAVRRRARSGGSLQVMFIDLDDFKAVNDLRGRDRGDELIQQVAVRLQGTFREADAIARLGGDEFAILFEGAFGSVDPSAAARRLIERFSWPFELDGEAAVMTASIGVATDASGAETDEELLRYAELAMYAAKAQGKRSFVVYSPDLHGSALEGARIGTELRRAVEHDEFVLFYQPIVDLQSGRVRAVEALVRWNHPERGLLFPNDFIPAAEASGWIVPIGEWVLKRACQALPTWDHIGDEPLRITVNVSLRQLFDPRFVTVVRGALDESKIDPQQLTLEVTESLYSEDSAERTEVLSELRRIGVKIAIDDFGTGYSALSSLRDMPVDVLKIDKSFVDHIAGSAEAAHLVQLIVQLAHDFRISTVAEGAEDVRQVQLLRAMGCSFVQGYYFSKPLPESELETVLQRDFAVPAPAKPEEGLMPVRG
jgi:diguanylate cyclase (GGDEF)-like protein/PAS domain S-box-containing protein